MVSKSIAMMLRVHGEFIRQIAATFEGRPFTAADIRTQGNDTPDDCSLQKLHRRGCIERVSKDHRYANTWKLAPELVDHYAAQGVQG